MINSAPPPDVSASTEPLLAEVMQPTDSAIANIPDSSPPHGSSSLAHPSQQETFAPEYSHSPTFAVESPNPETSGEPLGVSTTLERRSPAQTQAELLGSVIPVDYPVQRVEQSKARSEQRAATSRQRQNTAEATATPATGTIQEVEQRKADGRRQTAEGIYPNTVLPSTPLPEETGTESLSEAVNSSSIAQELEPSPEPTFNESSPEPSSNTIQLRGVQVTDNTVLSSEINALVEPFVGQSATLSELQEIAQRMAKAITQLYFSRGYLDSKAKVLAIMDGVIHISVVEESLERIDIENEDQLRVKPSYIRSRIELASGTPLNAVKLEEQLQLLKNDPLFTDVEAVLQPGSQDGQKILLVKVVEANPFEAGLSVDNYSPPSVGSERLGTTLRYRNLLGLGDELAGSYYRTTTGGANSFDFTYRMPLNAMNGALQLRVAPNWNEITQEPFDELDIEGETDLYELSYRQPLVRSLREEFALSLGFAYQEGQTFVFNDIPFGFGIGPDENGISRTSVIRFGQDYTRRDGKGAWALRSQFNLGTGLFDATDNEEPIPDGQFFSWRGQAQRVQQLGKNNQLIVQAELQLTPNSLLPSQQFVVGGGQSLRGYRQNVRSADNGFRFSIEDRITVQRNEAGNSILQIAPFVDMGVVWNHPDNPNPLPDDTFLVGAGLGLLWEPLPGLNVRLDYGLPLIDISDRGKNAQDDGFHFSLSYQI